MTIASRIAAAVQGASAITLYGGYCMKLNDKGGWDTVRFPTGHQEIERRNPQGRCTMARYHYADGSRLVFRWNEARGGSYTVEAPR